MKTPTSNRVARRLITLALVGAFTLALDPTVSALDKKSVLTLQDRADLVSLLQASQASTLELIRDLPAEDWQRSPAEGQWSVGQVVEHLIRAEAALMANVKALAAQDSEQSHSKPVLPLDELVALGADRSQKFTAPEAIQPTGNLGYDEAVTKFLQGRANSIQYVLESAEPLRGATSMTPIGQELDGYGWLGLLGAHNLRHNRQIAEVLEALSP